VSFEPKNLFILLALIVWVANSRRFENWLPYLGLWLTLSMATEIIGDLTACSKFSNYIYYNIFIVVDFILMSSILFKINPKRKESIWIFACSALIVLISAIAFLFNNSPIQDFATSVLLVMGGLLVVHSTVVILRLAMYSTTPILKSPEFWIALSPFFYFACFVPSFGMSMYFSETNRDLAEQLYKINDYLFVLRYLLILMGLILAFKKPVNAPRL